MMRRAHKIMIYAILAPIWTILLFGCAVTPRVSSRSVCPEVVLPPTPKRVEISDTVDAHPPDSGNTVLLSSPTILEPNQSWRAYPDGAIVWRNRDLRGILYGIGEQRRWIDVTQSIVDKHNESVKAENQLQRRETNSRLNWWSWIKR
jgi:hypothetical protein